MVRLRRPSSPAEVVPTTGGPSQEEQADIIRRNQEAVSYTHLDVYKRQGQL